MTIRIAVIGAGLMGHDHARIFAEDIPGATLQVVCDASEQRARAVADAFGAPHVATDAAHVIARADVDAVVIASPDATHAPLSRACIAAGKPVLCEKPLSQSSAECLAVITAEIAAGRRFIQLGFMRRFDQSYAEMKAALDDGSLGRALMMHNFHRNVATPAADFTADMAITNSAPHEFDVARFVLGQDYASISAFKPARAGALVGPVFMVLETTQGQLVNIEINNNAAYGYDVRAELVGEAGCVAINPVAYTRRDAALQSGTRYDSDWRSRYAEAYRRQNKAFLHFVRTGASSPIAANAWDGYAATVVAEAGVRALHAGRKTGITMVDQPAFYATKGAT
jgi:myo-inositol 2-dehydrogenase / D-chiro-inositol 1-dehydrogenase